MREGEAEGSGGGKWKGPTSLHKERGDKGNLVLAREKTLDCAATCEDTGEWKDLEILRLKYDWDAKAPTHMGEGS
jgi:hypothetical protein